MQHCSTALICAPRLVLATRCPMQVGTSLEVAAVGDRVEDLVLARLELRVPRELKRKEAGVRYRQLQIRVAVARPA